LAHPRGVVREKKADPPTIWGKKREATTRDILDPHRFQVAERSKVKRVDTGVVRVDHDPLPNGTEGEACAVWRDRHTLGEGGRNELSLGHRAGGAWKMWGGCAAA